jgi:hypothetical protein
MLPIEPTGIFNGSHIGKTRGIVAVIGDIVAVIGDIVVVIG